jgi:hypothetical protein
MSSISQIVVMRFFKERVAHSSFRLAAQAWWGLLVGAWCCLSPALAQLPHRPDYGRPLIVLYQTDPWSTVIGSDSPVFACYERGQVIYRRAVGNEFRHFQAQLTATPAQLKQLFGITDSVRQLVHPPATWFTTDQSANILFLHLDTLQRITVYGRPQPSPPGSPPHPLAPFFRTCARLTSYQNDQATPWLPDTFEVLAVDYSHSSEDRPPKWKKRWNDLRSPSTVRRGDKLYSIYLDKKELPAFLKLLQEMEETSQVVEINGGKYSLSYRWPFPNLR